MIGGKLRDSGGRLLFGANLQGIWVGMEPEIEDLGLR